MIYLVTGSISKFENAKKRLSPYGIEIEMKKVNLIEPQEDSIMKVAEYKIRQAFQSLNESVLITDTGWSIPALNGFPGPYMHYISDWFTLEDWINLLSTKNEDVVFLENVAVYKDSNLTKVFISRRKGSLLKEPRGEGLPIDRIATFREDRKTIAECNKLGIDSFDNNQDASIWTQFGQWYISK